jgi:glycosyltransferase involved in cell wall biosynthesis
VPGVSVTIITLNEGANIDDCLASVAWADDIVVVDSHSTDDTVERAKSRGARVIVRDWPGSYADQKNFAAAEARHDWILSVDADERVTPALAAEIRAAVATGAEIAGYRVPRVTWHLQRWIRTTDWYPDYQLRLYDRRRATWPPRLVHESVRADGRVAYLTNDLQHFAYRDIAHHHEVMNRYTTLAAQQMRRVSSQLRIEARIPGRPPGFHHLGHERPLRLSKVREVVGTATEIRGLTHRDGIGG